MIAYKEMDTHGGHFRVEIFPNSVEFAKAVETRTPKKEWGQDSITTTDDWALGDRLKNGGEALDKFKNGFNDTVKEINTVVNEAVKTIKKEKTVLIGSNVVGFAPIVPNAILGLPNSMVSVVRKNIKSKVVDVLYSASINCGVSSEEISEASAKLLKTIVLLEKKGYRVRLNLMYTYCDDHDIDAVIVTIKSENEPMTISRLTLPLTTPAMFRVLSFAWYERSPQTVYKSCYGHSWNYEYEKEKDRAEIAKEILNRPNSTAVYIECQDIVRNGQKYIDKCFEGVISKD